MRTLQQSKRNLIEGSPALVVVDIQASTFVDKEHRAIAHMAGYAGRMAKARIAIDKARAHGVPVIFIQEVHRPDLVDFGRELDRLVHPIMTPALTTQGQPPMPRIAIINDYQTLAAEAADWSSLPADCQVDISHDRLDDPQLAATRLAPYEIIVTSREETRFDRELIARLPRLELLITHGMRNAALNLDALRERGVTVCGTGYGFSMGTVELAWGLILCLVKNILAEDEAIRGGDFGLYLPGALTGKTLGVLGLGDLGSNVARIGIAFGMDVVAWSQNLSAERCEAFGVRLVDKPTLFEMSDVLSVHVQLSDRTRALVGVDDLARMKPTAFFINTSRGPVVDEAALVDALENRRIAGAGLDVFDHEPLAAHHPLRSLSNTVLTPHIGGRTRENFLARYADCLDDVKAWLDGSPVRVLS